MLKQYTQQAASPIISDDNYHPNAVTHRQRIKDELEAAGVSWYGRHKLEARYLPNVVHEDEHILGAVNGNSEVGSVLLVATDRRVIYLDKKPLFVNEDELTYDVVSGVRHWHGAFMTTVTLHTRVRDYTVDTNNERAAEKFVNCIEQRCLEHSGTGGQDDHKTSKWLL